MKDSLSDGPPPHAVVHGQHGWQARSDRPAVVRIMQHLYAALFGKPGNDKLLGQGGMCRTQANDLKAGIPWRQGSVAFGIHKKGVALRAPYACQALQEAA
jgi:hypothetical protein